MTTLRKAMPLLLFCAALLVTCLPLAAQNNPDCSFTYTFTGDATQAAVSNLSGNTPCVNWRITLSTDAAGGGTLSSTVTFQTSPDNSTFTAVPNSVCSSTVQPPCVLQGANPIIGTQGMAYIASYGAFVRVAITGSSGTGHGTVRGYGAKGATAGLNSLGGGGGGGSSNLSFVTVNPTGACTVGVPDQQNTVTGALSACRNSTWGLVIAANASPSIYYGTPLGSFGTAFQATVQPYSSFTDLTYPGTPVGTTDIQDWATNAGVPSLKTIPAGVYGQHIVARNSSGGNATLHAQFWEISSTGVDIAMIGQSDETVQLTASALGYVVQFVNGNVYTLTNASSRINSRIFATVAGSPANILLSVGGSADTSFQIPGNLAAPQPGSINCPDATGSTTVYTCPTPSPVPATYSTGTLIAFTPQTTNTTTTPTLNLAALGAKNLVDASGGAATLAIGQLVGGSTYLFEYDSTVLRLTSGGGGGGTGTVTSVFGQTPVVDIPVTTTDISTPANPAASHTKWYTKGGLLCALDPSGVETCTGGGGGSGTVTHTGALTANAVILGNGGVDVTAGDTLPADATKFYNGAGHFTAPPAASAVPAASNLTPVTVSANTTGDQTLQEVSLTAGFLNTVKAANLIHGSGRFTIAALQTPTLTFKAKLCTVSGCGSGTVVPLATITSAASIAATNNGWNLQLMAGTSASGATGNLWVHGAPGLTVDIGALPGSAATPYTDTNTAASSNIDLTAALYVDFTVATSSGNAGNSITQDIAEVLPQGAAGVTSNNKVRSFGASFGGSGTALTAGGTVYTTVPFACTISAWNIALDTGTATLDIWKIATGTAIPTIANTITAAALPAISSGTAIHSTTLTAWTTAVTANDIVGINLKVVSGATYVNLVTECDQ